MKKFKLIKEYPGSPKLGTEVEKEMVEFICLIVFLFLDIA